MEDLFELPTVDPGVRARARARRRAWTCFVLCAALFALHALLVRQLVVSLPYTAGENQHLATGMALRSYFVFDSAHTIQQSPLSYYATQLSAWAGTPYELPTEPTESNKVLGRFGMAVFTLLTLALLMRLSWRHCGPIAAVAAGLCYTLEPVLLAHAPLMSTDLAWTAGLLLTLVAGIHYLERPSPVRGLLVGVCVGLALGTRYLAVLLVPILATGAVLRLLSPDADEVPRRDRLKQLSGHILVGLLGAGVALHGCYGFAVGGYDPAAPTVAGGLLDSLPLLATPAQLLPDPWVRGFDLQFATALNEGARTVVPFLDALDAPSLLYYPVALATKLSLPLLVLLGVAAVGSRRWPPLPRPVVWLVGAGIGLPLAFVMLVSSVHIGIQHALPILPLLIFIATRPVGQLWDQGRPARLALLVVGIWLAIGTAALWPHYGSAFNALAGSRPYTLFGDATLDSRLVPHDDPARSRLLARNPGAVQVHFRSGARFGTVIVYGPDLWPRYGGKPGAVSHWVREFEPLDREGPYFCFKVSEDHFRLGMFDRDPARAARHRRNLAIALLGAGKLDEVDVLLERGADLPQVRVQLAGLRARPRDEAHIMAGWMRLGRYDQVLDNPYASPALLGRCYFELDRYRDCRRVLEREMQRRQLAPAEVQLLVQAQLRDHAIDRAIVTTRRHPPSLDSDAFQLHRERLAELQALWDSYQQLIRQIAPPRPK